MNTFVNRFSATGAASRLRKASALDAEDEEFSDAVWGSEAGFGSLAKGVPSFAVPNVADVGTVVLPCNARL
jgi:20S proteasome subunit beta 5